MGLCIFILISFLNLDILAIIFFAVILAIAACFSIITVIDLSKGCFKTPVLLTKWVYIATAGLCCFSICVGMLAVQIDKTVLSIFELVLLTVLCLTAILFLTEVLYLLKYKIFKQ